MIALALGGRTVAELKSVMSQAEFERWFSFYQLHPFDDLHRYHKPAALIATSMGGEDIGKLVEWLNPGIKSQEDSDYSEADLNTFKALGMTPPKRS